MNIYKIFYLIVLCLLITGCSSKNNDIVLLEKTIEDIKSDNMKLQNLNTELLKKYKQSEIKQKKYSEDLKESLMKIEELDNIIHNKDKTVKENAEYIKELEDINKQKKIEFNSQKIELLDFRLSPNKDYATIIIDDEESGIWVKIYLWDIINKKLKVIPEIFGCSVLWSPNGEFFIVDIGTGGSRCGQIFSVNENDIIKGISYFASGSPRWLDDSKIVYAKENKNIQVDYLETDGTIDVVIHNLETDEINKIFEGSKDFYFGINEVKDHKLIICSKKYRALELETETVIYKSNE